MNTALTITHIVLAILLIAVILMQQKGSGLGSAFGSDAGMIGSLRGVDKRLFQITIILAILFFGVALTNVFLALR